MTGLVDNAVANPERGEAVLHVLGVARLLRPTFTALITAEDELGPLFALVERAAAGNLRLSEMTALFWHCLTDQDAVSRAAVGDAVAAQGLAQCAKPLRTLITQILQGAG